MIAAVFATPLARASARGAIVLQRGPGAAATAVLGADIAWLAGVGILASAFLAAGTYNPFIYFRF